MKIWYRVIVGLISLGLADVATGNTVLTLPQMHFGRPGASPLSSSAANSTSQSATAATNATAQNAQTVKMTQQAQLSLQHSIQSLQAQQAAQNAARTAAQLGLGNIPNGLAPGGLVPDSGLAGIGVANPVTTWVNAKTPVQTTSNGQTTVTVVQTGQQALLNWLSFNIGKATTLDFDQSAGGADASNWVAINVVAPAIAPSQILGSMKAQGQVYVVNQNGIIFGGSSQVNMGALVASSLPINSNLVSQGLLNNPDDQFLFSQQTIPVITGGSMPAFTPPAAPSGGDGDIVVQAGAQLTSPTNANDIGGKIALIGPNVTNAGTISTPNGQTILAAGNQVGFAAHNSNDPTLRGLDVYVGAVDSNSGTAENTGIINAPEGDVTMTGKTVNQNGVINSSTSVSYNGRIDLLADYGSKVSVAAATQTSVITPTATGLVNFGPQSLTQIVPELSSTQTVVGSQLALSSIVNVQGQDINLNAGALLWAPSAALPANTSQPALSISGQVLTAGLTLNAGSWIPSGNTFSFANTTGAVSLGQGATIDVSGSENVLASVAEDVVAAQLLGTELADSPVQQNGPLRGKTIDVNLLETGIGSDGEPWIGTPLADVSGYINLVQHTVGELTTAGGSVAINAGAAVNAQAGSTVNVSGGWINYQGATVQTTKVISDGQILDISQANPNVTYSGVYNGVTLISPKWNVSQTYANGLYTGSLYDAGYIQGGNGGSLTITAPSMTLAGNFYGNTVAGSNQRTLASQLSKTYAGADFLPTVLATQAIPTSGSLTLNFQGQNGNLPLAPVYSPTPPSIDFGTSQAAGDLVLSPDLVNVDGFGHLTINNGDGSIVVPAGVSLNAPAGGSVSFAAANLDIQGSITAPSGNLTFDVYNYSPYGDATSPVTGIPLQATPPVDPTRGNFVLGSDSVLSTAGLLVNDGPYSPSAGTLPLATTGGTIAIDSFGINFAPGSVLNVSGGVEVNGEGNLVFGNAGRLAVVAGQDPNIPSLVGNTFTLGSTLEGYSGAKGGSLTIQAPLVQIGGVSSDPASALTLSPTFFTQGVSAGGLSEGGFAAFTLEGLGEVAPGQPYPNLYLPGVAITPGTVIDPVVQSWQASVNGSSLTLSPATLALASQRTPTSLTFDAEGVLSFGGNVAVRGDLVFGAGAKIETDPLGSVALDGQTVDVQGSVDAPGGTISVSGANNSDSLFPNPPDNALVTVDLGPNSVLSAAGTTLLTANLYGYRTGSVLAGGTISISGNILAEAGSVLNVSGATDVLDVLPGQTGVATTALSGASYAPSRVDSNGGSITLTGGQELFSAATLEGAAGGPSAQSGSLTVSSGLYVPLADINNPTNPLQTSLVVVQGVPSYESSSIGNAVVIGGAALGTGYFSADSFNSSGMDALTLGGTVQFSGPVQITANRSLAVGSSGIIYADADVVLTAPYVDLGQAFQGPLTIAQQSLPIFTDSNGNAVEAPATFGSGSLSVNATSLIDVGNLSLQGIGNLNLKATGGDIRGDGTLDVSGAIDLTAGQIYPTTETTFTIAAFDHNGVAGSVTLAGSGTRPLPLSGGGTLNVYATDITQGGVLRAPIGTINLGSGVTSASPVDPLSGQRFDSTQHVTLTSGSVTSVSAVDPVTGQDLTIPYGTILDGVSWIDPAGNDITAAGNGVNAIPAKAINVAAATVTDQAGATIDLSGGGDLYGYRFVSGTGGTVDILASSESFAVIPGYAANYAPFYSTSSSASPSDFTNGSLAMGEQIYLRGGGGLAAGFYTLLPAGYALLPGAFLVTPQSEAPAVNAISQPDGSSLVGGYVFNGLNATPTSQPLYTSFDVASRTVVHSRAEYDGFFANTFLSQSAASNNVAAPRLPIDAGQLVLAATQDMTILGTVSSQAPADGLGSEIDIASPSDIVIGNSSTTAPTGTLLLDAGDLSAFGADSLLIGGYRTPKTDGTQLTVTSANLTVDNSGEPLTGPDIILAANHSLTIDPDTVIEATGSSSSAVQPLLVGNSKVAGSGNGVLLRVSDNASAQVARAGVDSSSAPSLTVGAGATISGTGLILDSTDAASIDSTANLDGASVSIAAGQISLVLDNSQPTSGLVLSGDALANLQASATSLALLSYSSIDIYGSGVIGAPVTSSGFYQVRGFSLDASEILGFDGGSVSINAQTFTLDNSTGITPPAVGGIPSGGAFTVNASTIQLGGGAGVNTVNLDGYANVNLNATSGVLLQSTPSNATDSSGNSIAGTATLATSGNLQITTPSILGATGANQTIQAAGTLAILASGNPASAATSDGLGVTLNLSGATVTEDSSIILPSGNINIEATGGDVVVGGTLNVSGLAQLDHSLTEYTSGGDISLTSQTGSVNLDAGSSISVAAQSDGGNAGSLTINAPDGFFNFSGSSLAARAGAGGSSGTFVADLGSISGGNLQPLNSALDAAGFTNSISIRDRTDSNVSIDGVVTAGSYSLSADAGSITVNGTINASDVAASDSLGKPIEVGGTIALAASGSVTLAPGSVLTVAAQNFNNAGKGGSVSLAAGSEINGNIDPGAEVNIETGSMINLSVAANTSASAAAGDSTGTLQIRAPQTSNNLDLQVAPINGTILGAASITAEGYELYNLNNPSGSLIDSVETEIDNNGTTFAGNAAAITNRLLANNTGLAPVFNVVVGAEVINTSGDLTLANDWDLSTFRFGPNNTPGVLTLRAAGNLIFDGSLSDGFTLTDQNGNPTQMYNAPLMIPQAALPANLQSWSYNLTAGADFSAADVSAVVPNTETYNSATGLAMPGTAAGSLELGNFVTSNNGNAIAAGDEISDAMSALSGYYQVIRTGTGNINIATAGDVLLQNQFASIYTVGAQVADPTLAGTFSVPVLQINDNTYYPAQYSLAGGNVSISAQGNIAHVTMNNSGTVVMDSEKELPNNWLDRRGYLDSSGQFGVTANGDVASTSWWVDFSNFFEGVGTLGGGNVTLAAGQDVSNVDAVAPTNARMTYTTASGDLAAADQTLVELGGGNVTVTAGNDINGGVYYVERGQGMLQAGNSIITNSTRSPSLGTISLPAQVDNPETWLPTTLFLGAGSFDVTAQNSALLGPVANPFLLPQGIDNTYWDKTYFSTYAATDAVNVGSLTGDVTLREAATLSSSPSATPLLGNWLQSVDLLTANPQSVSYYQPWLNLTETSVAPFLTVDSLLPPALNVTAFSGNINTVGNLTLSPSAVGTVSLVANGSINGLQPTGVSNTLTGEGTEAWTSSTIDLSDANPASIPGIYDPYAYQSVVGTTPAAAKTLGATISVNGSRVPVFLDLSFIDDLFAESGSTEGNYGVLQTKLELHADINGGPLHANDSIPVYLYANNGDISGLTLFSPKPAQVIAGQDITDIALYIQNVNSNDVSLVFAGRDIVAYDSSAPLVAESQSTGNAFDAGTSALAGDIQIAGPGTIEVMAGRNLNLGVGPNNADGTGVGLTSIGNQANPVLPFAGADIVALAGVGDSAGLNASNLDFTNSMQTGFVDLFLDPATGGTEAQRYLPDVGALLGMSNATNDEIWAAYSLLPENRRDLLALDTFYLVLRDAGRDHNDSSAPGASTYAAGYDAIQALFPSSIDWQGDISLTSREIKTENGGNISLLAPGGALNVGLNVAGTQPVDQGILTEDGGNINIFTNGDVNVGTSRIFTLNGGNEIIWSSEGGIDAGASSKTLQSAPPTRVLVDPQSGAVQTDLAGLATGGGIGVLETRQTTDPADVDLIAPHGTVNAGDAGIRASGNLNIAALQVLNASNITVGGKATGIPTTATPNVGALAQGASVAGAMDSAANQIIAAQNRQLAPDQIEMPSIITVDVIGYGGSDDD